MKGRPSRGATREARKKRLTASRRRQVLQPSDLWDEGYNAKSKEILARRLVGSVKESTFRVYENAHSNVERYAASQGIEDMWKSVDSILLTMELWSAEAKSISQWEQALAAEKLRELAEPRPSSDPAVHRLLQALRTEWKRVCEVTRPRIAPDQFQKVQEWIPSQGDIYDKPHMLLLLDLMYTFGLRVNEALELEPRNCRPNEACIYLEGDKVNVTARKIQICFLKDDVERCTAVAKRASSWRKTSLRFNSANQVVSYRFVLSILKRAQKDLKLVLEEGVRTTGSLGTHAFRHARAVDLLRAKFKRLHVKEFLRMTDRTMNGYQIH
eukprot:gene20723-13_t